MVISDRDRTRCTADVDTDAVSQFGLANPILIMNSDRILTRTVDQARSRRSERMLTLGRGRLDCSGEELSESTSLRFCRCRGDYATVAISYQPLNGLRFANAAKSIADGLVGGPTVEHPISMGSAKQFLMIPA